MSIVNDAQHDPKALALIKAAYYCQLSDSRCVAEGGFTGEIYAVKIAGD